MTKYDKSNTPLDEHVWDDHFTVDKKPTCTDAGSMSIHCSHCSKIKDITEIPALGHDFGEWIKSKEHTCEGYIEYRICKVCGYTETRGIDLSAHEWEDGYTIDKEPTCHEDGIKSIHCKHCSMSKDSTVIPHLEHEWMDGTVTKEPTDTEPGEMIYICARCGEKKIEILPAKASPSSPATGDNSCLTLWIAIASGSLLLMNLLLAKRKKENV